MPNGLQQFEGRRLRYSTRMLADRCGTARLAGDFRMRHRTPRRHETAGKQRESRTLASAHPPSCCETRRRRAAGSTSPAPGTSPCRNRKTTAHRPGQAANTAPAPSDQPDLVAVPHGTDRVDDDAPLAVGARDKGQQRRRAEIEAVHDGKADQQQARATPTRSARQAFIVDGDT